MRPDRFTRCTADDDDDDDVDVDDDNDQNHQTDDDEMTKTTMMMTMTTKSTTSMHHMEALRILHENKKREKVNSNGIQYAFTNRGLSAEVL